MGIWQKGSSPAKMWSSNISNHTVTTQFSIHWNAYNQNHIFIGICKFSLSLPSSSSFRVWFFVVFWIFIMYLPLCVHITLVNCFIFLSKVSISSIIINFPICLSYWVCFIYTYCCCCCGCCGLKYPSIMLGYWFVDSKLDQETENRFQNLIELNKMPAKYCISIYI